MPRDQLPVITDLFRHLGPTRALIDDVRREKYMQPGEVTWEQTHTRVANALFRDDRQRVALLFDELAEGRACPAGRVMAGAGTDRNVTWWNCFVSPLVQDSMRTDPSRLGLGIMDALASVAYSMQMGGGVGTDFSPIRPEGAVVRRVGAQASGPLAFMDMWDGMCRTIMSAGARRGAMMATLICWHADILKFIRAKRNGARLRMFNVSVLVTDDFMRAVEVGADWDLGHWEPPFGGSPTTTVERYDPYYGTTRPWFVYSRVQARELWNDIMRGAYRYAEPGVIFIDRVNELNNLYYAEHVQCTNPCGEQALAPDDNCNLSHVNLARCVEGVPFSEGCRIDYEAIDRCARLLVRASDNVIDLSPVPTAAQRSAAQAKRRIGLGITGLANALMFVRQRYGSPDALVTTERLMETLLHAAYRESIELSKERGPFPLFDREKYLTGKFVRTLPEDIRDGIAEHGIRNALLTTVAPTGTISIAQGENSSGGLEPVFRARYVRKKLEPDNSFSEHTIEDLGFRVYANVAASGDLDFVLDTARHRLPDFMVTAKDLTPEDHLLTQAAIQKYVDNSVSKTINVPTETAFEDFVGIYSRAYALGCKGCTTYREDPASGRGAVLTEVTSASASASDVQSSHIELRERPDVLAGCTYRLRWSSLPYPMFVTVNDEILPDGRRVPFEVFINSKAVDYAHWVSALTRMISAVMRKGGDLSFIPDELKQVWAARGGEFIDRRYVPSEVALIGYTLERHFVEIGYLKPPVSSDPSAPEVTPVGFAELGAQCRDCGQPSVVRQEGCDKCLSCGWSNCG